MQTTTVESELSTETQTAAETLNGTTEFVAGGLAIYCVTDNRPRELMRLLSSVMASSVLPNRILIITTQQDLLEDMSFRLLSGILSRVQCYVDFICVSAKKFPGLSARKNVALRALVQGNYAFGLSVDDDMVFEPFTIQHLLWELESTPELFAVGPRILHTTNRLGIPATRRTLRPEMAHVTEAGVWEWDGFIQGVAKTRTAEPLIVEHLAGCFLHRIEAAGRLYDETYDHMPYFLHESDFVYGSRVAVLPTAYVYHWPKSGGTSNLSDSYGVWAENILRNVQYFAEKHRLGSVREINWKHFEAPRVRAS